jgi:hypothetical protein
MKEIKLPCGKVALVSDEDWPRVSKLSWYNRSAGYPAARNKKSEGGDGRIVQLHRYIMNPPNDMIVDHIDGDTFNCQRENLQITTQSRNVMKSTRAVNGGIQYQDGRWAARMRVDGKIVRLGTHATEADARAMLVEARQQV